MPVSLTELITFKDYIDKQIKPYARNTFSMSTYTQVIAPALDNLLEDLEEQIEPLAEEELYNYDKFEGE